MSTREELREVIQARFPTDSGVVEIPDGDIDSLRSVGDAVSYIKGRLRE